MSSSVIRHYLKRDLMRNSLSYSQSYCTRNSAEEESSSDCKVAQMEKLAKKFREKTPIGKLDEFEEGKHPYQEKEPLAPFPGGVNPETGEIGGPRGPEPTRYGDWERKGRVTDF